MEKTKDFKNILYEVRDKAAFITLNEPEKRNPLSKEVKQELCQALEACGKDAAVRVVVIRGAGGHFSAGGNAQEKKAALEKGILLAPDTYELGARLNLLVRQLPKPVIAVVEGAIAGSGLTLALSCDFQIVSETAKCSFAFVNLGIVPDCGTTLTVLRTLGVTRSNELMLSGKRFIGKQGADWGLFTEAVLPEEIDQRLTEYLEKYTNGPTTAYANVKKVINRIAYGNYLEYSKLEADCIADCEKTQDYRTAVESFLRKERPKFVGK